MSTELHPFLAGLNRYQPTFSLFWISDLLLRFEIIEKTEAKLRTLTPVKFRGGVCDISESILSSAIGLNFLYTFGGAQLSRVGDQSHSRCQEELPQLN